MNVTKRQSYTGRVVSFNVVVRIRAFLQRADHPTHETIAKNFRMPLKRPSPQAKAGLSWSGGREPGRTPPITRRFARRSSRSSFA